MKVKSILFDDGPPIQRLSGVNTYTNATVAYKTAGEGKFYGLTPVGHALVMLGVHWSYWSTKLGWAIDEARASARRALRGFTGKAH